MDKKENDGSKMAAPANRLSSLLLAVFPGGVPNIRPSLLLAKEVIRHAKSNGVRFGRNPHRTLAYYRTLGLVSPPVRMVLGTSEPRPYYPWETVVRLELIDRLKKAGMTLKQIRREVLGHPVQEHARNVRDEINIVWTRLSRVLDQMVAADSAKAVADLELLLSVLEQYRNSRQAMYGPGT